MAKKFSILSLVFLIIIMSTVACSKSIQVRSVEDFKEQLVKEGFTVGDNQLIAYEMVNANNGIKFELDGELIEVYEFDLNKLSNEAKETTKQAEQGSISMSGFNVPVKYNKGIMIARLDEHSQADKLIEILNSY